MKTALLSKIAFCLTFFILFQHGYAQKASKVELPSTYEFDYLYKLKMTHKKGDITFDYYLKEGAAYFGFDSAEMSKSNADTKMFMVMDADLGITAMFMEMMGKKVVQKSKFKASDFKGDTDNDTYSFNKIASKTIMGYECEGFVLSLIHI